MKRNQDRIRPEHSKPASTLQGKTRQSRPTESPRKLPADWSERYIANEFKVVALNERQSPNAIMYMCVEPKDAADYWRLNIATNPYFNSECECLAVLILNARLRVKGHQLVSIGTLDTVHTHAREIFRTAIVASAAAVILMHNHPSGDTRPSEADIQVTRNMARAGTVIGIEVLDHLIVTKENPVCPKGYSSLREIGYFAGV